VTELTVELLLRTLKLVVAGVLGALVFWVATALLGAPPDAQTALLAWLAGASIVLLMETSAF
jgi:hypothetical protein